MLPEDWGSGFGRTIGVFYNGHGIQEQDARGRRITDDSFLLAFNAHDDEVDFHLPAEEYSPFWDVLVDTSDQAATAQPLKAGSVLNLAAKSLVVLRAHSGPEVEVDFSAAASLAVMAEYEDEDQADTDTAATDAAEAPVPETTEAPETTGAEEAVPEAQAADKAATQEPKTGKGPAK
jgi:isoamylase